MSTGTPKVSSALQELIDKGVLERLPVSFSAFTFSQIADWDLLFPAERSYYERLFGLLDRSDAAEVDKLLAPVRELERRMGINEKVWPKRQFTLEQVDFLNRNALYPEWRAAVASVFARVDPLLDAEIARAGHSRLVVVISPAEITVNPDRMWLRIQNRGKRIALDPPEKLEDYLPLLFTGQPRTKRAPTIAELYARAGKDRAQYAAWIVEAENSLASWGGGRRVVTCSYGQLEAYRRRLMTDVNHMVTAEKISGPHQLSQRLKQMKVLASEGEIAHDAVLAEFARAVLLAGNGTLLINNTFVEWATVQAVRRAKPSVMISSFSIRNKMKPFSSLLIYADQDEVNPTPTQTDTHGTYVDLEIFHQYLWQEFEKYAEYRQNTAYLFVADGAEQMLAIAPPDFPLQSTPAPLTLDRVFQSCEQWLNLS